MTRLIALLRQAATHPKPRHPTRPSKGAKQRRLDTKHRHAAIKKKRGKVDRLE
jgi:ribosome-associated protein